MEVDLRGKEVLGGESQEFIKLEGEIFNLLICD